MTNQKPLPKETTENGIHYILRGDYYFPVFPDTVTVKSRTYGRWGYARLNYLKNSRSSLYSQMVLAGKLIDHLADTDEQANERYERMLAQMVKSEGITEGLKSHNQMEWVRRMNSIRNRVEEIILAELIYA